MNETLEFARGPLFVATFLFMALGLARHVLLRSMAIARALRRTPRRELPWRKIVGGSVDWMLPVKHLFVRTPVINVSSFLFHVGLIVVPIFLADHVYLWSRGLGLSWVTLGPGLADAVTLVTLATIAVLFGIRVMHAPSRAMSQAGDYLHLLVIGTTFATGYFASHPASSPMAYQTVMLVHVLSAELIFVLMPFSKLSHAVLFLFDRISMDLFWRLVPGAGARVAQELRGSQEGVEA